MAAEEIKSDIPAKVGIPDDNGEWKRFRESDEYVQWHEAIAPAVACRRRAFSILRDKLAVEILFDELADRFADRPGGYTRVIKLATLRLGDAGRQALIEFVGDDDKVEKRAESLVVEDDEEAAVDEESADEESADEESADEESADEEEADGEGSEDAQGEADGEKADDA